MRDVTIRRISRWSANSGSRSKALAQTLSSNKTAANVHRIISSAALAVNQVQAESTTLEEISRILLEKHGGRVPEKIEELLELPGVGRKTANCVLVYGFGRPAIPVDTHVHRISNRLGLVHTKTPEETEIELMRITDRRDWLELNEVFVKFGQSICRPIGPKCSTCILNSNCAFYREKKAAV